VVVWSNCSRHGRGTVVIDKVICVVVAPLSSVVFVPVLFLILKFD
jgi:hypothetical protein